MQEDRGDCRGSLRKSRAALSVKSTRPGRFDPARRLPAEFPRPGAQRGQRLACRCGHLSRLRLHQRPVRSRLRRLRCGANRSGPGHRAGRRRFEGNYGKALVEPAGIGNGLLPCYCTPDGPTAPDATGTAVGVRGLTTLSPKVTDGLVGMLLTFTVKWPVALPRSWNDNVVLLGGLPICACQSGGSTVIVTR